ncbi:efflux RND transporter periplasmic adaptor subunit [Chromobacterium piscinae]|uniref:efflux RND transporter periplasmic adaptor subunit n=1 Tax=Chromobacterium piscinae TaxID=686831 RepID=UPI0031FDA70A
MKSILPLALPLIAALGLSACKDQAAAPEDIRPVRYMTAGGNAEIGGDSYAGEIRARHETQLAFRVAGKVVAKLVNSGERVKKGQPLARLDPSDYQLDLAAKQAQLAAAESDLAQQQLNLKRYRELLAKQFISQAQVDGQQNGVNAAQAKVSQARAALSASRNQTGYATLTADADGVVSQMQAEPGLVVAAGQPVARLSQDGAREIAIQVPENALEAVRRAGASVEGRRAAGGQATRAGRRRRSSHPHLSGADRAGRRQPRAATGHDRHRHPARPRQRRAQAAVDRAAGPAGQAVRVDDRQPEPARQPQAGDGGVDRRQRRRHRLGRPSGRQGGHRRRAPAARRPARQAAGTMRTRR